MCISTCKYKLVTVCNLLLGLRSCCWISLHRSAHPLHYWWGPLQVHWHMTNTLSAAGPPSIYPACSLFSTGKLQMCVCIICMYVCACVCAWVHGCAPWFQSFVHFILCSIYLYGIHSWYYILCILCYWLTLDLYILHALCSLCVYIIYNYMYVCVCMRAWMFHLVSFIHENLNRYKN